MSTQDIGIVIHIHIYPSNIKQSPQEELYFYDVVAFRWTCCTLLYVFNETKQKEMQMLQKCVSDGLKEGIIKVVAITWSNCVTLHVEIVMSICLTL